MPEASAARRGAVLIAAGGTGGHVFPALAVAERLREKNIHVLWVGSRRGIETRVVPAHNFELHSVSVSGIRGKRWSALLVAPFQLAGAVIKVLRIALGRRVVCMLGTGGYVSAASGVAAVLLRKPFFLQEQNSVAGTTNKLLAPFAKTIFTAYPQAFSNRTNVNCCGNPLRREFLDVPEPAQRGVGRRGRLRVLVVGGSLGANALNATLPEALARFANEGEVETNVEIVHQSGAAQCEQVRQAYCDFGLAATVHPFIENIAETLQSVDLVVARAGALTVSELTAVGVAAVLVPYPYAIDDHQTANAQWLVEHGAALAIAQSALNSDSIIAALQGLLAEPEALLQMAVRSRVLAKPGATAQIAEACEGCFDAG